MAMNNSVGPQEDYNNMTPCPLCMLLQRRCTQYCPFSPYFPSNEFERFLSVHKVFGASNVARMLIELPESQRADTADSLIFEATVRLEDPLHGCTGEINRMQNQLEAMVGELGAVRASITRCRYEQASTNISSTSYQATMIPADDVYASAVPPSPSPPQLPLQAESSSSVNGPEPSNATKKGSVTSNNAPSSG